MAERHRGGGYERKDVPMRPLVLFVIVFSLVLGAILGGFVLLNRTAFDYDMERAVGGPVDYPPEPRLQPAQTQELEIYLDRQRDLLYGEPRWMDASANRATIPITEAMVLVARQYSTTETFRLETAP
ncbi:MAG: hypothetical protein RLY93_08670 [Sumerlaeia bacterium]